VIPIEVNVNNIRRRNILRGLLTNNLHQNALRTGPTVKIYPTKHNGANKYQHKKNFQQTHNFSDNY
jgi:hypothetical protein